MAKKILYFSAVWCGPCRMMTHVIDDLKTNINIQKIDVDNDSEGLTKQFRVTSIPTFILIDEVDKNNAISRLIGAQSKENLMRFYEN